MAISNTSSPPIHHSMAKSKPKPVAKQLPLKKIVTVNGEKLEKRLEFSLYSQQAINECTKDRHNVLASWQPERLEAEFDYQTDSELLKHSKDMLT